MSWKIVYDSAASREYRKLNKSVKKLIDDYLDKLQSYPFPKKSGKPMRYDS